MAKVIKVYAPIRHRPRAIGSDGVTSRKIVCHDKHPLHPANPGFGWPKGEVVIAEGDGMAGRRHGDNPDGTPGREFPVGVEVFDGSRAIIAALAKGTLKRLADEADVPDVNKPDENALESLGLTAKQIETLRGRGLHGVLDVAAAMRGGVTLGLSENVVGRIRDVLVQQNLLPAVDDPE